MAEEYDSGHRPYNPYIPRPPTQSYALEPQPISETFPPTVRAAQRERFRKIREQAQITCEYAEAIVAASKEICAVSEALRRERRKQSGPWEPL